jgi:hypothetical protein
VLAVILDTRFLACQSAKEGRPGRQPGRRVERAGRGMLGGGGNAQLPPTTTRGGRGRQAVQNPSGD